MRLAVIVILLITGTGCAKKECREGGAITNQINLHFELPVKIYPAKDTFHIGDTLWIEQEFSDNLQNTNNGKYYTLRNFDFEAAFAVIDLNQTGVVAVTNPKIIVYTGSKGWENSTNIQYKYENNTYRYKAAFIIEQAGLYMLEFGSTRMDGGGSSTGVTQCKHEQYAITFYNTDEANSNYGFLKNSVSTFYQERAQDLFNSSGGFAFYVK